MKALRIAGASVPATESPTRAIDSTRTGPTVVEVGVSAPDEAGSRSVVLEGNPLAVLVDGVASAISKSASRSSGFVVDPAVPTMIANAVSVIATETARSAATGVGDRCRIGCSTMTYDTSAQPKVATTRTASSARPSVPNRSGVSHTIIGQCHR